MNATNNSSSDERLLQTDYISVVAGVVALSAYWSWIFVNFSSGVVNPFPDGQRTSYLLLLVLGALCSGISVLAIALFPLLFKRFFKSRVGLALLIVISPISCAPALFCQFGYPLPLWLTYVLWMLTHIICSTAIIKSGSHLVRSATGVISRCVAISFLFAALVYALINCLTPVWGIVSTSLLLIISAICSTSAERMKRNEVPAANGSTANPANSEVRPSSFANRLGEQRFFAALTAIYSISFGIISCTALNLALENNLVFILVCAIIVSAIFLVANTFGSKKPLDTDRFKKLLLPLIVVALIPFNYLSPLLQVVFLSLAVFGFTCFDALSWEVVLLEVKERSLNLFSYASVGLIVSFFSIAVGWGIGLVAIVYFPENLYKTLFAFISTTIVFALVFELVSSKWDAVPDNVSASYTQHRTVWRDKCMLVANKCSLTAQETNVFLFLAKGRNASYVESVLYISGHTVKTHIYHIYKKLDVHSQQELIDRVEKTVLPN
jgi:DNA-binding CsgD family transcriptional regulator